MADIALTRIDSRLIHGQVHASVIRNVACRKLIIVDDQRLTNKFEKQLLKAACPANVKFELIGTKEAGERFQAGTLDKGGPICILFANVANAYNAYKAGLKFEALQVGGMRDIGENRVQVYPQCNVNEGEALKFRELVEAGVDCYFQISAADGMTPVLPAMRSKFPNL